jgi:hypothetical protein
MGSNSSLISAGVEAFERIGRVARSASEEDGTIYGVLATADVDRAFAQR